MVMPAVTASFLRGGPEGVTLGVLLLIFLAIMSFQAGKQHDVYWHAETSNMLLRIRTRELEIATENTNYEKVKR